MNEAQALRSIRNVVRLESLADRLAAPARRELTLALQQVAEIVAGLDADPLGAGSSLFRQARWRTIEAQLQAILSPASGQLYRDLIDGLAAEIPRQVEHAERLLLDAGVQPFQRANELSPPGGEIVNAPGVGLGTGGTTTVGPAITRTQLLQYAQTAADTEVLGRPLQELFTPLEVRPPRYPPQYGNAFIRSQQKAINSVVSRGFLVGETNQEIAKNLRTVGAARARAEADTIASTAVMQMSADAQGQFWDANSSVIAGWEFDASMDYRVCPLCAPWDGRTAVQRKDLPSTPVHPNCRCTRLPLTETELLARQQEGPQRRTVVDLVPYDGKASKPAETANRRVYARPVTVDGKRYWRVARDIKQPGHPLTMAEFLRDASPAAQKNVLGVGGAKKFNRLVDGGTDAESALVQATQRARSTPSAKARAKRRKDPALNRSAKPRSKPRVRQIPTVPTPR